MIICILLLLLVGGLGLFFRHTTTMLPGQQAAGRWGGDAGRFAQVTVFLPEYGGLTQGTVNGLLSGIWGELVTEGLEPATPAGSPVFAYSAEGVLQVSSRDRGPVTVYATGVGGNFFLFHPVQLVSGSMLPVESINRDLVLIDETVAWWLFGATDVAGMELIIGGRTHLISGVYRQNGDFASRAASGDTPHMFLYYDAMEGMPPITAIEAVLPNPISGIAEEMFENALDGADMEEGDFVLVNNTDRYRVFSLLSVARDFGQRSMYRTGLRLPYWENAARMAEDFAALTLVLMLLLLVYPVITAVTVLVRLWRRRKWRFFRGVYRRADARRERKREAIWQETHPQSGEDVSFDVDDIIRQVRESEEEI
ncbi:MAG: ABC transporter permease [Oscillospiraceae bacterium]|nr:ABC transporter permease [Oscillospiraceae bacterium]